MAFKKGTSGNLAGRPKTKGLGVRELVSRDSIKAYRVLWQAVQEKQPWALDIFFRELIPKDAVLPKD